MCKPQHLWVTKRGHGAFGITKSFLEVDDVVWGNLPYRAGLCVTVGLLQQDAVQLKHRSNNVIIWIMPLINVYTTL